MGVFWAGRRDWAVFGVLVFVLVFGTEYHRNENDHSAKNEGKRSPPDYLFLRCEREVFLAC